MAWDFWMYLMTMKKYNKCKYAIPKKSPKLLRFWGFFAKKTS